MSNILLNNIDHFDFSDPRQKLDSPRSLEALFRLGIDVKDLYYKDFYKFKLDNPEICTLPKQSQLIRWEHIENRRKQYIEETKMEREKLMEGNLYQLSKTQSRV